MIELFWSILCFLIELSWIIYSIPIDLVCYVIKLAFLIAKPAGYFYFLYLVAVNFNDIGSVLLALADICEAIYGFIIGIIVLCAIFEWLYSKYQAF